LLQQKLEKAKQNDKNNTKRSLKLEETKKAENNEWRAKGVGIDANLRPDVVEAIALRLVERIKLIVEDGEMLYVLTSQSLRIDKESFASVTSRGNGTRLITDVNGGIVTGTILKSNYGWKCKESLWTSTSASNMNRVEKRVHQLMYEDDRSIWIVNGAGGVKLDKKERVLEFSLSIIHGPSTGLSFAVQHPRTLPRILTKSDLGFEESSDEEDEDDYDTEPPVIEQDAEPNAFPDTDLLEDDDCKRPFILEDDDADDDAKSSAIKQLSKNPRNLSQLKDRSNDGGTKAKTKTQLTLFGQRAGPQPKKSKTTKTYVFSGKPIPSKPKN
jgi:hypothetical protein